jgi:hypothetical protein
MSKKTIIAFVAIALAGVIVVVVVPAYVRGHFMPAAHPCVNNLVLIDGYKQQWVLENGKTTNDTPTWEDLRSWVTRGTNYQIPVCPQGGTYTLGRVGEPPRCSLGERDPLYHAYPH